MSDFERITSIFGNNNNFCIGTERSNWVFTGDNHQRIVDIYSVLELVYYEQCFDTNYWGIKYDFHKEKLIFKDVDGDVFDFDIPPVGLYILKNRPIRIEYVPITGKGWTYE